MPYSERGIISLYPNQLMASKCLRGAYVGWKLHAHVPLATVREDHDGDFIFIEVQLTSELGV